MRCAHTLCFTLASLIMSQPLSAGELPVGLQAKFVELLCRTMGSTKRIHCRNPAVMAELAKIDVVNDDSCHIVWATSDAEVKSFRNQKKLVLCGKLDQLPLGGAIAVVEEGGKPQIYLHMGNIAAGNVSISDNILKIGKKF